MHLHGLVRRLGLRHRLLDVGDRDRGVLAAIETQQRAFQLVGDVDHGERLDRAGGALDRPVPRDRRLQLRIVRGIEPGVAAAAAESGLGDRGGAALVLRRPGERCVQVAVHLVVRLLADHLADDLLDVGHLREVGDAGVDLGRDRHVALLGEATAGVLDVFVDAEDLLVHQDDREMAALGGAGEIGGQIAVLDRDLHLSGNQPVGVGLDRLRLDTLRGEREAADQAGHHEAAACERIAAQAGDLGHVVHAWPSLGAMGGELGRKRDCAMAGWRTVLTRSVARPH